MGLKHTVGVAVIALVFGGAVAGCSTTEAREPSPSTSPSASPSPSVSIGPIPQAAPEGYFPVPMFAKEDIPWDEVGPGWFLIGFDPNSTGPVVFEWGGPLPVVEATLTLVSPNGELYAAGDTASANATSTVQWLGEELRLFNIATQDFEFAMGDAVTLNLVDGSSVVTATDKYWEGPYIPNASDYTLKIEGAEDTWGLVAYLDGAFSHVVGDAPYSAVSPDGTRVASISRREDGNADVYLNTVDGSHTAISVFSHPAYAYVFYGWLSNDVVLVAWESRYESAAEEESVSVFALDVLTGDATEYSLPFDPLAGPWEYSAGLSAFVQLVPSTAVTFYSVDGSILASVPCEYCTSPYLWQTVQISGDRAMVSDLSRSVYRGEAGPQHAVLTLVDPAMGRVTVIMDIMPEIGAVEGVFGHPNEY